MSKFFSILFLWFLIGNIFWYLIGSFIAFDFNPLNWWVFNNAFGRILIVFLELVLLGGAFKAAED